jgi:hypothetical protein
MPKTKSKGKGKKIKEIKESREEKKDKQTPEERDVFLEWAKTHVCKWGSVAKCRQEKPNFWQGGRVCAFKHVESIHPKEEKPHSS